MRRISAVAAVVLAILGGSLSLLAAGPEEFEMTTYQIAFLHKGPAWTAEESPERARLQEAHMAHIRNSLAALTGRAAAEG